MNILKKIRSRPEEERKKILVITVAIFMVIIIYFWASNLKLSFFETDGGLSLEGNSPNEKFSPYEIMMSRMSSISDAIESAVTNFGLEKKEIFER